MMQGGNMGTILASARAGRITNEMEIVAKREGLSPEQIRKGILDGTVVIAAGNGGPELAVGIGKGLRTKVNASIGTSSDIVDIEMEIKKARVAEASGADTLMELSTAGDLDDIRRKIIAAVSLPVGSVPLYQASAESTKAFG
jgi:phosphomethylpyrimidine synthase